MFYCAVPYIIHQRSLWSEKNLMKEEKHKKSELKKESFIGRREKTLVDVLFNEEIHIFPFDLLAGATT